MFADLARLQQGKSIRGEKLLRRRLAVVAKLGVAAVLFGLALGVRHFWKANPPLSVAPVRPTVWHGLCAVPGTKVWFSIWETRVGI